MKEQNGLLLKDTAGQLTNHYFIEHHILLYISINIEHDTMVRLGHVFKG